MPSYTQNLIALVPQRQLAISISIVFSLFHVLMKRCINMRQINATEHFNEKDVYEKEKEA